MAPIAVTAVLSLDLFDGSGESRVRFDVPDAGPETAMVLGELYLRGEQWKFRAVGQGWDTGLAGLATDYGIEVADGDAAPENPDVDARADRDDGPAEVEAFGDSDSGPVGEPPPSVDADASGNDSPAAGGSPDEVKLPRRRSGVRTRKRRTTAATLPALTLAVDPSWQPARLFSVTGVGNAEEQERRATSTLLSMMMAVRDFGRALVARFGGPAGSIETYLEVPFTLDERTCIPDGVVRVARAGRIWTALLEVKTGTSPLRQEQVERYLDLARQQGYDAVITLSNDLVPVGGAHPIAVDGRRLRKVALHHISWSEVLHEAQMQVTHRGVEDRLQAWLLAELVRYLEHPRSGAARFDDMGMAWVPVREAVAANTLRAADRKIGAVTASWDKLVRHLSPADDQPTGRDRESGPARGSWPAITWRERRPRRSSWRRPGRCPRRCGSPGRPDHSPSSRTFAPRRSARRSRSTPLMKGAERDGSTGWSASWPKHPTPSPWKCCSPVASRRCTSS